MILHHANDIVLCKEGHYVGAFNYTLADGDLMHTAENDIQDMIDFRLPEMRRSMLCHCGRAFIMQSYDVSCFPHTRRG